LKGILRAGCLELGLLNLGNRERRVAASAKTFAIDAKADGQFAGRVAEVLLVE
jgi:hypothetical protein